MLWVCMPWVCMRVVGMHAAGMHAVGMHAVGMHVVGMHAVGLISVGMHAVGMHAVGMHAMGMLISLSISFYFFTCLAYPLGAYTRSLTLVVLSFLLYSTLLPTSFILSVCVCDS